MYCYHGLRGWARSRASVHMILGLAAILAMVWCVLAPRPALASTGTRQLHLAVTNLQFTSFTCLNVSCSLGQSTIIADASSNLATGKGSFQATIVVDFSPGGTCNIVDEPGAFIFDEGTIFTHSHHEDCATDGLRIDRTFQVTGGTGAFAGATGGGREFSAVDASAVSPVIFNGTISY
jgi:hypothetical protein